MWMLCTISQLHTKRLDRVLYLGNQHQPWQVSVHEPRGRRGRRGGCGEGGQLEKGAAEKGMEEGAGAGGLPHWDNLGTWYRVQKKINQEGILDKDLYLIYFEQHTLIRWFFWCLLRFVVCGPCSLEKSLILKFLDFKIPWKEFRERINLKQLRLLPYFLVLFLLVTWCLSAIISLGRVGNLGRESRGV